MQLIVIQMTTCILVVLSLLIYKLRIHRIVAWGTKRATQLEIEDIKSMTESHEVATKLMALIHEDGAGSWPPRANYSYTTWPKAIQPYKEIYLELAPLLPQQNPSLDQEINRARIIKFRTQFQQLLRQRVDLVQVRHILKAADSGQWDVFPRDTYNAFYCCIASSRHAFRWATIPVVKVAQLEKLVDLPAELIEPWEHLQRHFACPSDSGNNMSNLVLNFNVSGEHVFKINAGMTYEIISAEEEFARIFHDIERFSLPVYHDIVFAIIAFARDDKSLCAQYVAKVSAQLRPILNSYYNRVHDRKIPRSIWLSHVQGFFAWGAGHVDESSGKWNEFDGLSGNQVLLFQVLDAFLGIEQYLSPRDQERNVPIRQREFCKAIETHSFRRKLGVPPRDDDEARILAEFEEILKRLRTFRTTHRVRAKSYLSQPAPERLPMTAGKSLLKSNIDNSLQFLDEFMVRRLNQTV